MNTKTNIKTVAATLALGVGFASAVNAQPAPQVFLNGQPLRTEVAPINQNGRLLVPMRDIFESLGATVNYNNLNRSIAAQRGTTIVRMALGTRNASVNNVPVRLDVPAVTYYNRTFVPLRFVSEALGADVSYNAGNRVVSINGQGYMGNGTAVAGIRQISIPANTVIPVTLDNELSSATATVGQNFTATVVSERLGDSEFPAGTTINGRVTGVQRRNGDNPGTLDLRFDNAVLPNGSRVPLNGTLIGLDNDSVTQVQNGNRVTAKGSSGGNNTAKVIGIGAGAGFVIGRLLKKDGALPAIIGAAGGFLFDRSRNNAKAAEARIAAGERLGVRVNSNVTYTDSTGYAQTRATLIGS